MFLRWVLTTSGFSLAGASFFFFLSFLIRAIGFLNEYFLVQYIEDKKKFPKACVHKEVYNFHLLSPLENFLLILQTNNSISCSLFMSRSWSRSTPLDKEN